MQLKLLKIILYPQNTDLKPKVITFLEDKVNVITGYSQRGKSAIIHIVDYCLGSFDCNIPIGKIRTLVDKFAIIVSLEKSKLFIARDSPDSRTNVYYEVFEDFNEMSFSLEHWIPDAEKFKTNREDLKSFLGEIAGFENLKEKDDSKSGFDAPASFRDTSAFQFQPQNIIANPTTMFYKTDSFEHLRRLQTLFPLVLGYKSYEIVRLEKEIEVLDKELKDKQNKYDDIKKQYENWQSDIYEYYSRALKLGLTKNNLDISSSTVNLLKNELKEVVSNVKSRIFLVQGSSIQYSQKIEDLDKIRLDDTRELDRLKSELVRIEKFDRSKEVYLSQVVGEVNNRLKPVDWFILQKGTNRCPFCDSESDKALKELLHLQDQKEVTQGILESSKSREFSFEEEKITYKRAISAIEKKINEVDSNLEILVTENKEYYQQHQEIFEFIGKIELVLTNLDKISPSGLLQEKIQELITVISLKRVSLKKLKESFDKDSSLNRLTNTIDNYVRLLPIEERQNRRVKLDPEVSVNIRVEDTISKNITFLSKLGSGANHMCYHLATLLGLHEFFLELGNFNKKNYIPSFLILDQPSQVYFPENFPDQSGLTAKSSKVSEDIRNTTAIFSACSQFLIKTKFQTQIIILEHAPISTWAGIDNIHLVEEWRGEDPFDPEFNALIPRDWH